MLCYQQMRIGLFKYLSNNLHLVTKYFVKNKKIKQNWTKPENFDIWFCVRFDRYCQKLNFRGETGH